MKHKKLLWIPVMFLCAVVAAALLYSFAFLPDSLRAAAGLDGVEPDQVATVSICCPWPGMTTSSDPALIARGLDLLEDTRLSRRKIPVGKILSIGVGAVGNPYTISFKLKDGSKILLQGFQEQYVIPGKDDFTAGLVAIADGSEEKYWYPYEARPDGTDPEQTVLSQAGAVPVEFTRDPALGEAFTLTEYQFPVREGTSLGSYAVTADALYYWLLETREMGNDALASHLMRLDLETRAVTELYSVSDSPHWINEFTANEDGLFWAFESGGKVRLQQMKAGDAAPTDLRSYDSPVTLLLTCDSDHLVWTEVGEESAVLCALATGGSEQEVRTLSQQFRPASPWGRVQILDGLVAFQNEAGDLCVYDLESDRFLVRQPTAMGETFDRLQANREGYVVWSSGSPADICVWNMETGAVRKVSSSGDGRDIFSFHLWGSMVVLNDHAGDRLIFCDLERGICTEAAPTGAGEPTMLTGKVMGDGRFLMLCGPQTFLVGTLAPAT